MSGFKPMKASVRMAERDDAPVSETEALEYMANADNWLGDPVKQDAILFGHETPYELARRALPGYRDPNDMRPRYSPFRKPAR